MKKEDLFQTLGEIDPAAVAQAGTYRGKKKMVWKRWTAAAACIVLLAGSFLGVRAWRNMNPGENPGSSIPGVLTVQAAYPDPVAPNMDAQQYVNSDEHYQWWRTVRDQAINGSEKRQEGMRGYYSTLMAQLLTSEKENTVCSPLNTYFAFAMLAEVTNGNTRQQILDMLGTGDIETLRENFTTLWESNYANTPLLQSNLANSLWLSKDVGYNEQTLDRLAREYHASSFRGTMGSPEMDAALQQWTDDNTGHLLTEYTQDMHMEPSTVLEILSTIYYKAMWGTEFSENQTIQETFHGSIQDTNVPMMKRSEMMAVAQTEQFSAVSLKLNDSGSMYFFLPDEGVDVNSLLTDSNLMKVIQDDEVEYEFPLVHLSVPKFKVSGKVDLLEAIHSMGIVDALDPSLADFTPLTTEREGLFLSKAEHAAMLEIDEHGVTGAAYTELAVNEGAAMPHGEMDFVLNRPFLFVVTSQDGSLLFSGIVRNIEE